MYNFCLAESVGGKAVVVSRQLFDQTIDSEKVRVLCARIADKYPFINGCPDETTKKDLQTQVSELKRTLPGFCWHASAFKDGKRNAFSATQSDLTMTDVDHVDEPQKLFERVRDAAITMGLVAAHITPSTFGLRLVFVRPQGVAIEQHQAWITEQLQLTGVDGCTKDLPRLSFVVPRGYWLYIDYDALFGEKRINPAAELRGTVADLPKTELRKVESPQSSVLSPSTSVLRPQSYDTEYKGIPYSDIVQALEDLYGGKPTHGSRNSQIFSMACQLRYICNDDPMWIAAILPNYGEAESRWMSTIRSACQRNQVQNMPAMLTKAIEMAKLAVNQRDGSLIDTVNQGTVPVIDANTPPKMPSKLPKLISHLIKNVPEVCRPSVANGVFPSLATHLAGVNFPLIDGTMKEATFMCVNMARQSSGKASVNKPIDYIMADIKERDELSRRREQEWKDAVSTKGSNKEKPKRPDDLCVQMLVTDMTNAAFVQRLKDAGNKYIYTNLEELDLLKQLQTNGTRDVGKIICLCFDNGVYGQERVGLQSITALLQLRWNWNASSTIEKGRDFFRNRLIDGTLSRVNFCTIISDETKEFRYGTYDEKYAADLKPYITNLNLCKGEVVCDKALAMARRLQQKCTEIAAQTEDIIYQEFAYRAVTIAYMKAIVLYIAQDMTWDKTIDEFCEWSLEYDLWCKNYFFGQLIAEARETSGSKQMFRKGNMLNLLPDRFTMDDAQEIRRQSNKNVEGTSHMLSVWAHRGYIAFDADNGVYEKAEKYRLNA